MPFPKFLLDIKFNSKDLIIFHARNEVNRPNSINLISKITITTYLLASLTIYKSLTYIQKKSKFGRRTINTFSVN